MSAWAADFGNREADAGMGVLLKDVCFIAWLSVCYRAEIYDGPRPMVLNDSSFRA